MFVMILVVGGDPAEHWKSIEDGQPIVGQLVEAGRFPDPNMIVVVSYGGNRDGQTEKGQIQEGMEGIPPPLADEQCRGDHHENDRPAVRLVP